jgi:DNA topoisomerase-1
LAKKKQSQKSDTILVVVESPAKIKTLQRFLGSKYIFESSYGHIRDLPKKSFGVDIENDFTPTYEPLPDKKKVIQELKRTASKCAAVYLAPDPDREGEAIAWHISQILGDEIPIKRVSFNSITKEAVQEALSHPSSIDMALVNAQQARRLLDRLVGYSLSPLVSRKLGRQKESAISAGRVQSVALKLIVDRERAIEAFVPQEYWNITLHLSTEEQKKFSATLHRIDGKRIDKELSEDTVTIPNEQASQTIVTDLASATPYRVEKVEEKERVRQPEAPFITSTLQQEASRHFRFSPARTMEIAQGLYEGIDLGPAGAEGLITYMRTDSVRIAPEALTTVRSYIESQYGAASLPQSPRLFHVKKSAQDAHEAIRPTDVRRTPESLQEFLSKEQLLLYSLIWKRFVASQMTPAIYDTISCDIQAGTKYIARATGSKLRHQGFLTLYEEKNDEDPEKDAENTLPELSIGQTILLDSIEPTQSFTRPPPRFTEASLVKELEKSGIGRPSTYAAIMKKISAREYTVKEQGRLKPTELGRVVTEMLEAHFQELMNIGFTASMEDSLEEVAANHLEWQELLKQFWEKFSKTLDHAKSFAAPPKVLTEHICPKCHAPLQKIWSKSKYFLGCSKYPECSYSISLEEQEFDKSQYQDDFNWEQLCPQCNSPMKVRFGKFGPFLGCSAYPECRGIVNIPKKEEQQPCPATGCGGTLVQKRSRFGKPFWSCSNFPACDVIGNSVDAVKETFSGRPQTAYEKKAPARSKKKRTSQKKKKSE